MRTALCADDRHQECNGRCTAGFPEQNSPTKPCECTCHQSDWQQHMADADRSFHQGGTP
jgi:hypothetical protein